MPYPAQITEIVTLTCAPIYELPSTISTMELPHFQFLIGCQESNMDNTRLIGATGWTHGCPTK